VAEPDRAVVRLTLRLPPGPAGDAVLKGAIKFLPWSFGRQGLLVEEL
jgi:hypothetical protein